MNRQLTTFLCLATTAFAAVGTHPAPVIVGTPPADAGRGLLRVSATEIRHYDGDRKHPGFLVSRDNGETWKHEKTGPDYPPKVGLDEHRARTDYATWGGPQDRGNHQVEFVPLDAHRIPIAYGQHKNHRRIIKQVGQTNRNFPMAAPRSPDSNAMRH